MSDQDKGLKIPPEPSAEKRGGMPIMILVVLLATLVIGFAIFGKVDKTPNQNTVTNQITTQLFCARAGNVIAQQGVWSQKIKRKPGYALDWGQDVAQYGIGHAYLLVEVRVNGEDNLIKKVGRLPNGDTVQALFSEDVDGDYVQFRSMTSSAVCMKVQNVPK